MNKQLDGRLELDAVTDLVRRALSPEDGKPEEFYAVMRYAMGWTDEQLHPIESGGGKLHRPRLCMLACLAAGGELDGALPAAAALELLHNFTLVHDDIQDDSPQRRHRPSVWSLVGMPLAINTGDGMFVAAHRLLGSLVETGLDPALVIHALDEFDRAALKVCEGQHMDISFERRDSVSSDEYLAMIERKTGALMGLSCYLGALTAGAPRADLALYRAFGEGVGAAYQVRDDLMGVWQDEASTGKRAMEDLYSRKKSYPAVRAFELAAGSDAQRLRAVYSQAVVSQGDALWVRELMTGLGLREEGAAKVEEYTLAALGSLDTAGADGPGGEGLRQLARGLRA